MASKRRTQKRSGEVTDSTKAEIDELADQAESETQDGAAEQEAETTNDAKTTTIEHDCGGDPLNAIEPGYDHSATFVRNALANSGTGAEKLAHIDALIEANVDASAEDAVAALIEAGCGDVTVGKAKKFAGIAE